MKIGNVVKTEENNSFANIAKENLKGTIPVETNNQKRTIIVHWNWPFNEEDETSTDSEDATLKENIVSLDCGFDIQIIGKQANLN